MLSRGAGAEMRAAIGTAVFFGMLGVTFFGIFLTPVFYVVIRGALERKKAVAKGSLPHAAAAAGAVVLLLLGISSAMFLNGCTVGPNYHPPKTEVSAAFANGSQTNITPAPTAVTWWQGFNDPLLNRLVAQSVTNNPDLRIATAHVQEARALRMGAVADLFPRCERQCRLDRLSVQPGLNPLVTYKQRQLNLYNAGFDATGNWISSAASAGPCRPTRRTSPLPWPLARTC